MKRILTWILALVLAAACCVPAMAEECSSHSWKIGKPATCGEDGNRMCTICGKVEPVEKTGNHTWKTVEPTCGKDGRKLCTVCGVDEVLPATGAHDMKISKEPTCAEEGEKTCTVCGYPEKIAKNENHEWKVKEPTCVKEGTKLCVLCGKTEKIPATGVHNWNIKDAGCEAEGKKLCTVCGTTETIAPKGHSWVVGKEATCTEKGDRVCAACDKVDILNAKGHTEVVDAAKEATCTETGLTEGKHCSVCNEVLVEQKEIPAKGHTEVIEAAKEATCTETGLTEGRHCSVCNEVLVKQEEVPANGHKPVVIPAVEATCKKEGSTEGAFCEVCGVMLTEPQKIPAKKHSYYYRIVEPTADKSGYMLHICRNCGRQYSTDRVEALGQGNDHIYGIVTDVDRVVKDYTLNTAGGIAVIKAAAEADGMFATRCLFLSEETVQKLVQAGCSEVRFAVGSASVSFPLNALGSETVVITLSIEDDSIGVKATIDNEAAQDVTEKLEGLTLTISDAENTALATESGRAYDATFENGVWTIKAAAAETYILTAAK